MEENPNNQPTQQTTSEKNLHRRSRYAQMSTDKKQLFLSQLIAKRAESKRQKNLDQFNSAAALTITTSSLAPQQASKPTYVPSTSTTRDHIVTCLSTFKQGIEEDTDNVSTQEQTSDRNSCRRTKYAQMSPETKQSLLLQLREKRAESKRQKTLHQSNSVDALTITTSSVSPQQCTSTRGEHMVDCLSSFEVGSTSAACHVASKLPSTHSANKGQKENKTLLLTSPSNTTSTSSSIAPMIATPSGQQLISIAEISSAPSMGVFYVQAEMAILDEFQDFCVLECSGCKQKKRTKDRKDFDCPKCNRKTSLVPRCSFQIDLIDNTATTTASISAELGEKLLSMTAEDIFDITCTKRQSLSLNHVHEMLSSKVFEIQLRKSSWSSSNTTTTTLSILSYMEKHHTTQSATDRTSKKIKPLEIGEVEVMATTAAAGPSNAVEKFEPPTPTKKV